ncbi:hypothetical protein GGS20DRAFT_527044 [Poronia punctata]|nr:hypothetical protein GGS20DRAFT_527044 [Poronia punctata]
MWISLWLRHMYLHLTFCLALTGAAQPLPPIPNKPMSTGVGIVIEPLEIFGWVQKYLLALPSNKNTCGSTYRANEAALGGTLKYLL